MNNHIFYAQLYHDNQIPVLCSPWWLDAVCGEENWDVAIYEEKGKVRGVFPYFKASIRGFNAIIQPPFTQYYGPVLIYPDGLNEVKRLEFEKKTISNLLDLISYDVDYISFNANPTLRNWLPFYWRGYNQTSRYTYSSNNLFGKSAEDLLQGYTKSARKKIRKLYEDGYFYKEADDIGFTAKDFFDFHSNCLKKINQKISYDEAVLKRMVNYAYMQESGKLLVVMNKENKVCGATFFIFNNTGSIGINTAADHTIDGLGYLLHHLCILESSRIVDTYNIGGSMIEGVEQVYRQLGLHQTEYFALSKNVTRRYRIYSAIRNLGKAILKK